MWIILQILLWCAWTLLLYWVHRAAHVLNFMKPFHDDHHNYIVDNKGTTWNINNIFLFNDTWYSTVDLWLTEVIPTLVFAITTGAWWIAVFYWLWAAFFQENIEHNLEFNYYPFTSGRWHLVHHQNPNKNYGLFFPVWDKVFRTEQKI